MSNKLFYTFIISLYFIVSHTGTTEETTIYATEKIKHKQDKAQNTPTKLDDIIYFKDLGDGQYTLGFGFDTNSNSIKPLAVYDKTFSGPLTPSFWHNLLLASLGINDLNLSNLHHSINKRKKKKKFAKKMAHLLFGEKSNRKDINFFPKNWWKNPKIQWRETCKPDLEKPPPKEIPLNCIILETTGIKNKTFNMIGQFYSKLIKLIYNGNHTLSFEKQILQKTDQAIFQLQHNGTYQLISKPTNSIPPIKIIDLKASNSSLHKAALWATTTNAAKVGIGFIPLLGIPQLIIAFMERVFNLVEVLYLIRHARALNMVAEALDNNKNSPFYSSLTKKQLLTAVKYLKRTNTLLSGIISSAFTSKKKIASNYINYINKQRKKSIQYLVNHNYKVYPFEKSYYALGIKKNNFGNIEQLKVFSLIKNKTFRKRPHDVVNFIQPKKEVYKRNILEAILVGTSFLCTPLPLLNSAIKILYKELIIREIHRYQMQEAGFKSHLKYNKENIIKIFEKEKFPKELAEEFIDFAIESISNRELNPLELGFEDENKHQIKVNNWLKENDPSYY